MEYECTRKSILYRLYSYGNMKRSAQCNAFLIQLKKIMKHSLYIAGLLFTAVLCINGRKRAADEGTEVVHFYVVS